MSLNSQGSFINRLRESAQRSADNLEGHSDDEIKEILLKKAGVNARLLNNPVSREALFNKLKSMYPFKIENKIIIDKDWIDIYGHEYDSISLIDLFVSKIKGDAIKGSAEFTKWSVKENGDVELTHTTSTSLSGKNDWYDGTDTIRYGLEGENICITNTHKHNHFRKNNNLEQLAFGEEYTKKDVKLFNTNGIQLKWKQEKLQYLSRRFYWIESGEYFDSKEMNGTIEISRRNITVSRDASDLSTAIVESSYSTNRISIDLTNSEKDISTLDAARDIVNDNKFDQSLSINENNEPSEVKKERLSKKINESKYPEGCKNYGDLQKGERIS